MAAGVPPPPLNSPSGSYYWLEWYTSLTNFLNGTNIPWSNINFSTSNIADIATRPHNSLTGIQGGNASQSTAPTGNAYHLLGYGYSSADASSVSAPGGWTVAHIGTGTYTVTHGQGLTVPDYPCGATANTSGTMVSWVDNTTGINTFTVHTVTAGTNTAADAAFSFWLGRV